MKKKRSPRLNYDLVKAEALKYTSRNDFRNGSRSAYDYASRNRLLDVMCSHMEEIKHKWIKEECRIEALKFNTRSGYAEGSKSYEAARKNGWLDEVCSHMGGYIQWTDETAINEAKKYVNKTEFRKNCSGAVQYIISHNLYDVAFSHMESLGNKYNRGVYTYKLYFENKWYAYSGLTHNFTERHNNHKNHINTRRLERGTRIDNFCIKNNLELPMYEIYSDYVDVETAQKLEQQNLEKLEKDGFILLNKSRTGGLGGSTKYSLEIAKQIIKERNIKTRTELSNKLPGLYEHCSYNFDKDGIKYIDILIPKTQIIYSFEYAKQYIKDNDIKNRSELDKKKRRLFEFCKTSYNEDGIKYIDLLLPTKKKEVI